MIHEVESDQTGVFILTDTTILQPLGPSNFILGNPVRLEYAADQMVIIIDDSIETTNPYTETWHVAYTDMPVGLEMNEHQDLDTTEVNNLRYDHDPIDLIIWVLVIVTTWWMLIIDFKLLFFWR